MNHDPYRAPSAVAPGAARSRWVVCIAVLTCLQWLIALLGATSMFEMVRYGDVPIILFGAFWLAHINLAVGAALLLWRKPVAAAFLFAVSALCMSGVLIDWRPLSSVTGFAIAAIGLLLGLRAARRKPQAQI